MVAAQGDEWMGVTVTENRIITGFGEGNKTINQELKSSMNEERWPGDQ